MKSAYESPSSNKTNIIYGANNWEPLNQKENAQFEKFLLENNANKYEKKWDRIYRENGVPKNQTAKAILNFIDKKTHSKTPFSIIRVNDGEGTLMFGEYFKNFNQGILDLYIIKRISYIIFGSHEVIPNEIDTFRHLLIESMENADIIGIPVRHFIQRHIFKKDKRDVDVRAALGSYAQISYIHNKVFNEPKIFMNPWLSKLILPQYPSIFSKFKHIAIITGNLGLGKKMENHFSLENVTEITIPTQRSMLNPKEPLHWPNRYNEVLEEINKLEPNTLVLVAAGILGKPYCNAVKKSNNSAIEIGHVADIWDGKATRQVKEGFIKEWSLKSI